MDRRPPPGRPEPGDRDTTSDQVDDDSDSSFPASDPPAWTSAASTPVLPAERPFDDPFSSGAAETDEDREAGEGDRGRVYN